MRKIIILIFFFIPANAEVLKPNSNLLPYEVISIQLSALKNNNNPYIDAGIEQTWEFAHPSNKKYTGPLSNFINMMYSKTYRIMLNHKKHDIILVKEKENISYFFIEIIDKNNKKYGFQWTMQKVLLDGKFKDCWMTIGVSTPIILSEST